MGNVFAFERGTGTMILVDGAAATPSLSFVGDADTGLFHSSANVIEIVAGGSGAVGSIRIRTGSGLLFSFGNTGADGFWTELNTGHLVTNTDDVFQIGLRTGNRPSKVNAARYICGQTLVSRCTHLVTTCVALTIRNGASTGTLTNSPTAGNPEVWAQVNNNGCTYVVPLWRLT